MNNKLRQKILKELNVLLKEQVDTSDGKPGGSYGSGTLGRVLGTGAVGAGAAGLAAYGAAGAAVGLGAGAGIAFAAPIAVPLLAVGALYLAFRTAGWQEVSEDIMDSNEETNNELAAQLPTKKYLDFTTMSDATDLSDFKSFMAAMKGLAKRFSDVKDLQEYATFMSNVNRMRPVVNKICDQYILLNETGFDDKMYYVKCAKVRAYDIPANMQMPTATPTTQQESLFRKSKKLLSEQSAPAAAAPAAAAPAAPAAAAPVAKCTIVPDLKIPVELYEVGLESEVEDPSVGPTRVPTNPLPEISCPLVEQVCGISPTPVPNPTPGPDIGPVNTSCKKCKDMNIGCKGPDVAEIHTALIAFNPAFKTSGAQEIASQTFGAQTADAIIKFKEQKKFMSPPYTAKVGPATCRALGISGGGKKGGGGSSGAVSLKGTSYTSIDDAMRYVKVKAYSCPEENVSEIRTELQRLGIQPSGTEGQLKSVSTQTIDELIKQKCKWNSTPTTESKNYYDNKKLNEAKTLFNKLLKNL